MQEAGEHTPAQVPANNVVAAFVIDFNSLKGNSILWQHPADIELPFVEYKAMPSGSHVVKDDFSYTFLCEGQYAVSCFKTAKDDGAHRGLRARSVGLVFERPDRLHAHRDILRSECERQMHGEVREDDQFTALRAYYDQLKKVAPGPTRSLSVAVPEWDLSHSVAEETSDLAAPYEIPFLAGGLSDLVSVLGKQIMLVWKIVLLQKRLMFLSHPPMDPACQRVFAACALGSHTIDEMATPRPFLYQNVSDIPFLSTQTNFVCCVSETIFELKTTLYDAFVTLDNKIIYGDGNKSLLKLTSADKTRYKQLLQAPELFAVGGLSEEEAYLKYFVELNNRIFGALSAAKKRTERVVTKDDLVQVGLSPNQDGPLLQEIAAAYCPELEVEDMGGCGCM